MLTALQRRSSTCVIRRPLYQPRTLLQLRESNTAKQVLSMTTFMEDNNLQADVELHAFEVLHRQGALGSLPLEVSYFNRGQILTEEYYTLVLLQRDPPEL